MSDPVAWDEIPSAPSPYTLRRGVCKITTNNGDGTYKVTEQWYEPTSSPIGWTDATAPGLVTEDARDYQDRACGNKHRRYPFWEQRANDGAVEVLLDVGESGFWAKITASGILNGTATGHATDPSTKWRYSFSEVEKTGAGYGGWTVLSGGRADNLNAYNTIEDINTTTGADRMGNGVQLNHLDYDSDGTYEYVLRPVPNNVIVRMHEVIYDLSGAQTTEYWFSYENGVDGECG